MDPKWSWYNSPASYDVGTTTAGQLHLVAKRNTNFGGSSDSGALLYQNASGNFSIETKLSSDPGANFEKAGIMVRNNASNWVGLFYQAQNGKQLELTTKVGGAANDHLKAVTASPRPPSTWQDVVSGHAKQPFIGNLVPEAVHHPPCTKRIIWADLPHAVSTLGQPDFGTDIRAWGAHQDFAIYDNTGAPKATINFKFSLWTSTTLPLIATFQPAGSSFIPKRPECVSQS